MGVLIAIVVVLQVIRNARRGMASGFGAWGEVVTTFSYFTIGSNTLAGIALIWAALAWWRDARGIESRPLAVTLAATSVYMVVTGLVFNLVLRPPGQWGEPTDWLNVVQHIAGPAFLAADVFVGPRRRGLRWGAIGWVLLYPVTWVALTLLRAPGALDPETSLGPWYPYPFIDPATAGWGSVGLYVLGIAVLIIALAWAVVAIGRRRAARLG